MRKAICFLLMVGLSSSLLSAQGPGINERIKAAVEDLSENSYNMYVDLHQNPSIASCPSITSLFEGQEPNIPSRQAYFCYPYAY